MSAALKAPTSPTSAGGHGTLYHNATPLWVDAEAVFPWHDDLARKFTRSDRFGTRYALHRRDGNTIRLPRHFAPAGPLKGGQGDPVDFTFHGDLRPGQIDVAQTAAMHLGSALRPADGIVEAATGWGKTVLAFWLAAALKTRTIAVVTKDDQLHYWRTEATKFLGLRPQDVGIIQGPVWQVDRPFVVAMMHTLAMSDVFKPGMLDGFGFAAVDEVHKVGADVLGQSIGRLPAMRRLGISATPKRADGRELLIFGHFGAVLKRAAQPALRPRVVRVNTGWPLPKVLGRGGRMVPVFHEHGRIMSLLRHMIQDPQRNAILASFAVAAYGKGRRTLFFSDMRDHLDMMQAALIKMGVPPGAIGQYVGGMTEAQRDDAKTKPVMLATYQMAKDGTNIPALDTTILGTPLANITQAAGRILRVYEGKQEPVIVDPIDTCSQVLRDYADSRMRWYHQVRAHVDFA